MEMFFKNELHEKGFGELMVALKQTTLEDPYYTSFAYLVAGAGKASHIIENGINEYGDVQVDAIYETIKPFSGTEKNLIRFGLQCFNANIDDITFPDVINGLDTNNTKVVKQALNLRYKF